ncbi:hypothetical protein HanIR_Chr12g0585121 [Helianthus annuus]|nr:hypothetical protein HanIR_Chr12g0585121 [Helianthus annuus]
MVLFLYRIVLYCTEWCYILVLNGVILVPNGVIFVLNDVIFVLNGVFFILLLNGVIFLY